MKTSQLEEELSEVKKLFQTEWQKLCDEVKVTNNSRLEDLEKQWASFRSHTMPLPVPPFYVSLQSFHHYQSNDLAYVSESFYSHPGGYKMCICVRPNGSASFKGTHMGVYVAILHDEFDEKLRWPLFDGSVTIHVYNRTIQQWSNEKIIKMNKTGRNLEKVDRCVDQLSHGNWGYHDFILLPELEKDYVKEVDVVRFRVTNVHVKTL